MNYLERNYKIVEEKMISQTDLSLSYGRELIETELDAGAFNAIVKPIVRLFYKLWSDNNARVGTIKQIEIALDSAKSLLQNGEITQGKFDELIEKRFPSYLENDQTDKQCNKKHDYYNKLKQITRNSFISQVEECVLFLNIKDEVKNYEELSRAAFKTKEKAYEALKRQLDYNDDGISIVEQDDSILNVPTGKKIIVTVLRKGFEKTKEKLIEELDLIFN